MGRRNYQKNTYISHSRFHSVDRHLSSKRQSAKAKSSWDVAPRGFEHLTPMEYKAMLSSGQIPLRIVPDLQQPAESAAIATVTRQARRIYVGNIPFSVTDEEMIDFFNQLIMGSGSNERNGKAILTCQANIEKNFAFLEFRSMDEATHAMNFDGIYFRGQCLKIRRPHDYHRVEHSMGYFNTVKQSVANNEISNLVPDSPQKLYIGGLPISLTDKQIKELLQSFGELRGFNLVKDTATCLSKGFAFCEYLDASVTDQAILGLNGMKLGNRKLVVERSTTGGRSSQSFPLPVLQVPGFPDYASSGTATQVLCLLNMVLPEELLDDEEFEDIRADILQECNKHGNVSSVKIPRPFGTTAQRGCGKVYVMFEAIIDCQKALNALSGRKFNGRIVVTSFYNLEKFKLDELD